MTGQDLGARLHGVYKDKLHAYKCTIVVQP